MALIVLTKIAQIFSYLCADALVRIIKKGFVEYLSLVKLSHILIGIYLGG
jgi:hypothetical protein